MRSILVTGAAGFVGSNLVKRLAEAGEYVIALDRSPLDDFVRLYLGPAFERISFVQADVCDASWHRVLPTKPLDVVIHAAAVTNVGEGEEIGRATDAISVNIGGTANVLIWAFKARPARVVYISSSSVYGTIIGDGEPIDESWPTQPTNLYGISKFAGEQIAFRIGRLSEVPVIAARLVGPFGPMERTTADRSRLSPICTWCEAAVNNEILPVHRGYLPRDWIYVKDTAEAVYRLAIEPKLNHRIYNVSSGSTLTCDEIIAALTPLVPTALRKRLINEDTVNPIARPVLAQRLQQDTGWKPKYDLRSALADYVAWLRDGQRQLGRNSNCH